MKNLRYLSLACFLACPQLLIAAEQDKHKYTAKEKIIFSPATMLAFDRSGKKMTRSKAADGSTLTEHNGSMGNVTVARLGPDGKVETFCTTDASDARNWMAGELDKRAVLSVDVPIMEK